VSPGSSSRAVTGAPAQADGLAAGIARLRRALRRGARVADPGNTLAVAQLELLAALAEHPGARPGELARLLNMRPNTVTTIVNALSARGMLCRTAAAGDRRAVELTVTGAGQQAVLAWQATNAAVLHLALSTLPARQRRALAAAALALDALARAVDRLADTPGSLAEEEESGRPRPLPPPAPRRHRCVADVMARCLGPPGRRTGAWSFCLRNICRVCCCSGHYLPASVKPLAGHGRSRQLMSIGAAGSSRPPYPAGRVRVPPPLIRTRLPSGRGATEQPNATGDGDAALSPVFWVMVAATGVAAGLLEL